MRVKNFFLNSLSATCECVYINKLYTYSMKQTVAMCVVVKQETGNAVYANKFAKIYLFSLNVNILDLKN